MSRTRYTENEKALILWDFEHSGQGAAAFYRQRGVSYQTLVNWRRTAANIPSPEQAPAFLEFELGAEHHQSAPAGPLVELELGGGIFLRIFPARSSSNMILTRTVKISLETALCQI